MNRPLATWPCRARMAFVALAAVLLGCATCAAEDGPDSEQSSPAIPQFRRIFVPADQPATWPTGDERYLPIGESEFTRLLRIATADDKAAPGEFAPRMVSARYRATLDVSGNLSGDATLEIEHRGTGPALARLRPWALAITGARWQATGQNQPTDFAAGTPAAIGNLSDGTLCVLVPGSGKLLLKWNLIGKRSAAGILQFPFEVCSTASSRLELIAPAEVVPELDRALVESLPSGNRQRQWNIDLGGRGGGELRLVGTAPQDHRNRLALLRQEDSYHISRRGLDCTTMLNVFAHGDSLSSVELEIDPGLELTQATLDGQKLVWSVGPGKLGERRHVRVELPKPISGECGPIALSAIAALPLGNHVLLPRLQATNLFWQEGSVTLSIEPPLRLNQIETNGARPTAGVAAATSGEGEVFHLQCLAANDEIRIEADFPQTRWSINEGAHIEFLSGEVVSHSVADYTLDGPDTDRVTCRVNPDWQIDSVEAELPAKVSEWEVVETDIRRELLVRLRPEEAPTNRVRLKVTGRKPFPMLEPARVRDLAMLSFPSATSRSRSLLLQTPETLQIQSHGLEAAQSIDLNQLARDNPLFVDPMPVGKALKLNADAERVVISVIPRRPQFNAEVRIVARVEDDSLLESCELVCLPSGAVLDRLLVHTSKSRGGTPWEWSGDSALGKVTVRKLTPGELRTTDVANDGDAWELSWRLPQRERVTLRGTRRTRLGSSAAIALVAVPEAATQSGQLQIAVEDATDIEIHNKRLTAIPSDLAPPGTIQQIRGTYQFDPARHGLLRDPAIVIARPAGQVSGNRACVTEATLDTRLLAGAAAQHVAVFRLQTMGQPLARFTLPAAATVVSVNVNGVAIDNATDQADHSLTIRLPEGAALATITICYQTQQRLPRFAGQVRPEFPRTDMTVLSQRWRLWLPVNYDAPTESLLANRYCRRSATWSERLFGPLGRGEDAATRNPFTAGFWTQYHTDRLALERARTSAIEVLRVLGDVANSENHTTWGKVLTALAGVKTPEMFVSWSGLSEAGISASDRFPTADATDPIQRGTERLRKNGLSLLVRGHRVLLVSTPMVALNRHGLQPLDGLPAFHVGGGVLAAELDQPGFPSDDLLPPAAWQLVAGAEPTSGEQQVNLSVLPTDVTMIEFHGGDASQFAAPVFHQPSMYVVAAAMALLVLGLGIFRQLARHRIWPLVMAASFSAALLVPIAWTALAAAVVTGSAGAWLLLAVRRNSRRNQKTRETGEAHSTSGIQAQLTASSLSLILVGMAAAVMAQQPPQSAEKPVPTAASEPAGPVQNSVRVLVPIDESQHSVGTSVYLPESFYTTLLAAAERVREVPRGWMFTDARYRAAVAGDLFQPDVRKLTIQARFTVHVFESNTTVHIRLGDANAHLVAGSLLVDGRGVEPVLDPSHHPTIPVAEPGKHSVEMLVEVPIRILGAHAGVDLAIPQVANAELELSGADALRVDVPGTLDKPTPADGTAQRHLLVGNLTRLAIRWPDAIAADEASEPSQIDELYWVRVKPGSVSLDARLSVHARGTAVHGLQLQIDSSMVLLDPQPEVRVAATRAASGNRQLIDLELRTPIADQRTIDLHFVVPGISGTGNLRLPLCQVTSDRPNKRWVAVSVDPVLSYARDAGEGAEIMEPADFIRAWGSATAEPQLAYRLMPGGLPISISTQPRSSSATAETTLSLVVDPTGTDVVWSANVSAAELEFQWQLKAPPTLAISALTITQPHGDEVPLRWSQDRDAPFLHATASTPVRGEYRVTVRGRVAHEYQARMAIPTIEIARVEPIKQTLLVYRHRHVQVTVSPDSNWEPSTGGSPSASSEGDRLLGEWVTLRPAAGAEIRVAPNLVEGSATQVVTVEPLGDQWSVEIDCHLVVRGGMVDRLTWEIPATWSSFKLASDRAAATLTQTALPDGQLQRLTVRPTDPVQSECRYRIVGQLPAGNGLTVRMPVLQLEGIDVRGFALLPRKHEQDRIQWELSQLVAAELPTGEGHRLRTSQDYQSYRVVGDRPRASLREVGAGAEAIRPLHVEHCFRWTTDGCYSGLSTFVLDHSLRSAIEFELPPDLTLVHCRVGGIPVAIHATGARHFQIPLLVTGMTQWIELLVSGRLATAPRPGVASEWTAPRISGVRPDRSYWVLHNPFQTTSSGNVPQREWQSLLSSRLAAANVLIHDDETVLPDKPASAFVGRTIGATLQEMELLVAMQQLPVSTLPAVKKTNAWLAALPHPGVNDTHSLLSSGSARLWQDDHATAVTDGDAGTLALDAMQLPQSNLLMRFALAVAAIFLAAMGAAGMTATQRLKIPPIVAGILVAGVLWIAVTPVLLPAFVLILSLLWIVAPGTNPA